MAVRAKSPSQSKQERVYETLRERILDLELRPGSRLVIGALAKELGVSSQPVREAVRRLEAEGLVVFSMNAGATVAPADAEVYEDGVRALALLEGNATARVASRPDLDTMREQTAAMRSAIDRLDVARYLAADHAFHSLVDDACENPHLRRVLVDTRRRLLAMRRTLFADVPYRALEATADHTRLVEVIADGAGEEAIETVARAHLTACADDFRRSVQDAGRPQAASVA